MDAQPTPSKTLIVCSVLVIAGSLFLLAGLSGVLAAEPDNPFTWMGAVLLLPLLLALAIQQYRGTFRRRASAAWVTSIILYGLGGLLAFGLAADVGEGLADGISLRPMAGFILVVGLITATCLFSGRVNYIWSRALLAAATEGDVGAQPWRFSLREVLLWFTITTVVFGYACYVSQSAPPRLAEHVDASAVPFDLPAGATDVSYWRGIRGSLVMEFSVDEEAFRQWVDAGIGSIEANSAGVWLREITSPFSIQRYAVDYNNPNDDGRVIVTRGLYYSWSKEDRAVNAAFDRSTGRAYYSAHYY